MISRPMQHGCDVLTITTCDVIRIKRSVDAIYDIGRTGARIIIVHKDVHTIHHYWRRNHAKMHNLVPMYRGV